MSVDDPGFEFGAWRVYLDGEEVTHGCREADDAEGYVVLIVRDAAGAIRLEGGEVMTNRREGKVEIARRVNG